MKNVNFLHDNIFHFIFTHWKWSNECINIDTHPVSEATRQKRLRNCILLNHPKGCYHSSIFHLLILACFADA